MFEMGLKPFFNMDGCIMGSVSQAGSFRRD